MADLQRLDAGLLDIPRLQRRDHLPAVILEASRRIEGLAIARSHIATIALQVRKVIGQRRSRGLR